MTVLELIKHVGGIREYCWCISEWSDYVGKAHKGKHKSDYFNRLYRSMTVEYYIMRLSRYKVTRPYVRKAPVDSNP